MNENRKENIPGLQRNNIQRNGGTIVVEKKNPQVARRIGPHSKKHLIKMVRIVQNRDVNPNEMNSPFVNAFLESIPYFQNLKQKIPASVYDKLSKEFMIKKYKHLDEIISFGEIPNFFYVLVTGSVYVLIKKSGIDIQVEGKANQKNKVIRKLMNPLSKIFSTEKLKKEPGTFFGKKFMNMFHNDKKYTNDQIIISQNYPNMICIRHLEAPNSFGGLAIEQDTVRKRTATILSKGKSILFAFPLNIFRKLKKYTADPELKEKSSFLQEVPIFSHWSSVNLVELLYHLKSHTFRNNSFVYKIGEVDRNIYVIRKGKFELRYRMISKVDKAFVDKRIVKLIKIEKELMQKYQDIPICILGAGEIVGYHEYYRKMEKKITSLRAITDGAEIFTIDARKFFTIISDQITIKAIERINMNNQILIEEKIHNILGVKRKYKSSFFDFKDRVRNEFTSNNMNTVDFVQKKRKSILEFELAKKIFKMSSKIKDNPSHQEMNERTTKLVANEFFEWVSDDDDEEEEKEISRFSNEIINSLFYDIDGIKHSENAKRKMISCQKYIEESLRKKLDILSKKKGKRSKSQIYRKPRFEKKKIISNTMKKQERIQKIKKKRTRQEEIVQRIIGVKGQLDKKFLNKMKFEEKNGKKLKMKLAMLKEDVKNKYKDEFDIVAFLKKKVRVKKKHDPKDNHRFYSNKPNIQKSKIMSNVELKALSKILIPDKSPDKKSNKLIYNLLQKNILTIEKRKQKEDYRRSEKGSIEDNNKIFFQKVRNKRRYKDIENSGGKTSFILHNDEDRTIEHSSQTSEYLFFSKNRALKSGSRLKPLGTPSKSRMMLRQSNKKQKKKVVNYHMHNLRVKAKKRLRNKRLAVSMGNALPDNSFSHSLKNIPNKIEKKRRRRIDKNKFNSFSLNVKKRVKTISRNKYKIVRNPETPKKNYFFHLEEKKN